MKKLLLIIAAALLLIACNNKPERYTTTAPEIDISKALIKDYTEGKWENWIKHYADSAKIGHNSITTITPQELSIRFQENIKNYSSYKFSDENIFYELIIDDKNEKWVYFWGTWEATAADINKEVKLPVHLALKFENNKIVEEYGYYDTAPLIEVSKERAAALMPSEEITE